MLNQNNAIEQAADDDTEEVVSDLLYTLMFTMDEYVTRLKSHGSSGDDLTKMQEYIEKEMRWYAQKVYNVEVEDL